MMGTAQHAKVPQKPYTATERYNDSLLIYNVYKTQIEMIQRITSINQQSWYDRSAHDDSIIACALIRLKTYNKEAYQPDKDFNREGLGVALHYPAPSLLEHSGQFVQKVLTFRYSILDTQTHFMSDSSGRKIPYNIRYYYDHGRIIAEERINPITFEKIKQ
jgi:hypothetical protein